MATPTSYVASAVMAAVTPLASAPPEYNSEPAWKLPGWAEPVVSIIQLRLEST
jgi:hypothetical protein